MTTDQNAGDDLGLIKRGLPVDRDLQAMALSYLLNTFGRGATLSTTALYFTRHHGISVGQIGVALGVAAAADLFVSVPAGNLADRRGPREVAVLAGGLMAITQALLVLCRDFWSITAVLILTTVFSSINGGGRNAIIGRTAVGRRGVTFKAYLRSVTNAGIGLGALAGGVALSVDQPWAYVSVLLIDAVTSLVAALLLLRLRRLEPAPARAQGEPVLKVLRDRPFAAVTLMTCGVFALHFEVMALGVPLWIGSHTEAPRWVVSTCLIINTAAVALFQVRLSRGTESVDGSARRLARSGLWIAGGLIIIALAGSGSRWLATALALGGASLYVVGEMIGSAGQWGISFGLAPAERQGQYQGLASAAYSVSSMIGPPLVAFLCIQQGLVGWIVLSVVILLAGFLAVPLADWALRSREAYGVTTHTG